MTPVLFVFVGGGLGAVTRYGLSLAATRAFGPDFPWGTLGINVLGSLVMGLLAGFFVSHDSATDWANARLLLMTGILGGFTTFSAFSLDTLVLWERGDMLPLAFYVLGSVMISIVALFLGYGLTKGIA